MIAYLVNQYPKVSHSFIRREILALEQLGFPVLRVAVRGWDETHVDPADVAEQARTHYLLIGGSLPLLASVLSTMARRPRRFGRALQAAVRAMRRSERPWPWHLAYLAEACRLAEHLEREGATHIHAHFGTNPAQIAMLASLVSGLPYSVTIHGSGEFDRPEYLNLAEKIGRAAFVVAVSSFGRAQIMRWCAPEDWRKIHVVHCGIDALFRAPPPPQPNAPDVLVCVGRLSAEKGHLVLLEAARTLVREGREFRLVLAGDGPMRPALEEAIRRDDLGGCVEITGWLTGQEIRDRIVAARALVVSSFAENLPVVLMEAMALERPVVAPWLAGIPELVGPEVGWLVPAGSADALADAMRACLSAPSEEIRRMGRAARARALARHDCDEETARLAALLGRTAAARERGAEPLAGPALAGDGARA